MKPGDLVEVKTESKTFKGYLMPQKGDSTVIKLKNGYNLGINSEKIKKIKKIGEGKEPGKIPSVKVKENKKLPQVTFISTGGTIGTHVDYLTGGVFMCRTPEQILANVPELGNIINLKTRAPFTVASEDMQVENWQKTAEIVAEELNSGAEGVILTHGTDYLHFTGTALSFMLPNLSKPVALVGAQRSPDRGSFDGNMNLMCAAHYAKSDIAEVSVVMHGTSSDDYCLANRAVKCRKMHTSRRDAFRPINDLPIAKIHPDGKIKKLSTYKKRTDKEVAADTRFEKKVAIVKTYIGADPSIIDWYIDKGYKGLVIEGSALGHVPTGKSGEDMEFDEKMSWINPIQRAVEEGIVVVMASTCLYGRVNPFVYRNLRLASDTGMIYGKTRPHDMLPEVAYIKLGWVLGHTTDPKKAKQMMVKNYYGEISERSDPDTFLY